jgi:choline dehydrogenase
VPVLLRPLSLGRIYLSSANPFAKPIIDPNFFSHPNDIRILAIGVRIALHIARAKAFQPVLDLKGYSEDRTDYYWPSDADPDNVTDQELQDFIRRAATTVFHPVGTARMGQDKKDSVVDPKLRVHGVQGLRIVDASIFPRQVSGHPVLCHANSKCVDIDHSLRLLLS